MTQHTQEPKIEYVIFDMDGLLIDSTRVYSDVTDALLAPYGKKLTWAIKAGLMGKSEREGAAHMLSFFPDLPPSFTIDHYLDARRAGQDVRWPTVRPLPGALRLVQHLHVHGIPIALATGSPRRNFALKSAHLAELFDCFEGRVVCADDGVVGSGRGKPHPDIFLAAAERFLGLDVGQGDVLKGCVPEGQRTVRARGLVFEDGIPGVQAGKRAGMNVVWVPDVNLLSLGGEATAFAVSEEPDLTLKSLEAFVPEEWGLPPYVG